MASLKIQSLSTKLNPSGLAISEGWSGRCAAIGISFRKVCEEAEAILYASKDFRIKEGSLYAMANVWRFQPPSSLLLVHEIYKQILGIMQPMKNHKEAYFILVDTLDKIHFTKPVRVVRYYLAIEQALLWAEEEAKS